MVLGTLVFILKYVFQSIVHIQCSEKENLLSTWKNYNWSKWLIKTWKQVVLTYIVFWERKSLVHMGKLQLVIMINKKHENKSFLIMKMRDDRSEEGFQFQYCKRSISYLDYLEITINKFLFVIHLFVAFNANNFLID